MGKVWISCIWPLLGVHFVCHLLIHVCMYYSTPHFLLNVGRFFEDVLPVLNGKHNSASRIDAKSSETPILLSLASLQLCARSKIEGRRCCPPQRAFNNSSL